MNIQASFSPADILLPQNCDLSRWAVVACDQYTSEPEYWQRVADYVGDAPSTLQLILPESKLEGEQVAQDIAKIHESMQGYLENGRFETLRDSFVYIERKLHAGATRRGILGKIDLEDYSYEKGAQTPVRATEGTVLARIPPRMAVRRAASVELPHILVLIDDPDRSIIEPLGAQKGEMQPCYTCTLMEKGGEIAGFALSKKQSEAVLAKLANLAQPARFEAQYKAAGKAPLSFAVGDGNHSLATAKACWEELKKTLADEQKAQHPARFALVELGNLHDESLEFEAIHRVVVEVEPQKLLDALLAHYQGAYIGAGAGHQIRFVMGATQGVITVPQPEAQLEVGTLQNFLDAYLAKEGGKVDYIHGEDVVARLSQAEDAIGFLLPCMGKEQLFPTVIFDGALPRKTFSMGAAHDKRFYLEARAIQ